MEENLHPLYSPPRKKTQGAIPFLGICSGKSENVHAYKILYMSAPNSFLCHIPKQETNCMPFTEWTNK